MTRTILSRYGTRREFTCPIVPGLVALAVGAFGIILRGGCPACRMSQFASGDDGVAVVIETRCAAYLLPRWQHHV
jgi:hypothetical protein